MDDVLSGERLHDLNAVAERLHRAATAAVVVRARPLDDERLQRVLGERAVVRDELVAGLNVRDLRIEGRPKGLRRAHDESSPRLAAELGEIEREKDFEAGIRSRQIVIRVQIARRREDVFDREVEVGVAHGRGALDDVRDRGDGVDPGTVVGNFLEAMHVEIAQEDLRLLGDELSLLRRIGREHDLRPGVGEQCEVGRRRRRRYARVVVTVGCGGRAHVGAESANPGASSGFACPLEPLRLHPGVFLLRADRGASRHRRDERDHPSLRHLRKSS